MVKVECEAKAFPLMGMGSGGPKANAAKGRRPKGMFCLQQTPCKIYRAEPTIAKGRKRLRNQQCRAGARQLEKESRPLKAAILLWETLQKTELRAGARNPHKGIVTSVVLLSCLAMLVLTV